MRNKLFAAAVIILMLSGSKSADAYESRMTTFPDVPGDAWSAEHVYTLTSLNAIEGYEDGTFRPLKPLPAKRSSNF